MFPVQRVLRERDNGPRLERATATGDNERARVRGGNTAVSADTALPLNHGEDLLFSRQRVFDPLGGAPKRARATELIGADSSETVDPVRLAGLR